MPHKSISYSNEDAAFFNSTDESSRAKVHRSIIFKARSILVYKDIVTQFAIKISSPLLEVGGGYGYLSSYIKSQQPNKYIVYSDVSKDAIKKSAQYEKLFDIKLDEKWQIAAEALPFTNKSFGTVLFFSSFHHVLDPQQAIQECFRVLKPGGQLLLLFEPSTPRLLDKRYHRHAHRDEVDEKHYSVAKYRQLTTSAGFSFKHHNYRNITYRWNSKTTIYYMLLSCMPRFIVSLLPCTQVIICKKPSK